MALVPLIMYFFFNGPWWWAWQRLPALRGFAAMENAIQAGTPNLSEELDAQYLKGSPGAFTTLSLCTDVGWTNKCELHGKTVEQEYGSFTRTDTTIKFVLSTPNSEATGFASHHVVRWGPRVYLIPIDQLDGFQRMCSLNAEPRNTPFGNFFLREGDHLKPVNGKPTLPLSVDSATIPKN